VQATQVAGADAKPQLTREVQQLRIELSQKNLKIESIEAAAQRHIADLEQRLAETAHQRQQLQVTRQHSSLDFLTANFMVLNSHNVPMCY